MGSVTQISLAPGRHAAKDAILAHRARIETRELVRALAERRAAHKPARG